MRSILVLVLALGCFAVESVARAQGGATAEPCAPAARGAGTETAGGIRFAGSGQGFVSEPFALPEGTVVVSATIPGQNEFSFYKVDIVPAPGSTGDIEPYVGIGSGNGSYDGAFTRDVRAGGEFVLELVTSGEPWSATVEF